MTRDGAVNSNCEAKLTILMVSNEGSLTGAPLFLERLARELSDDGYRVAVFFSGSGVLVDRMISDGFEIYCSEKRLPGKGKVFSILHRAIHYIRFFNYTRHINPDIIYSNTIVNCGEVVIGRILGLPILLHMHEGRQFASKLKRRLKVQTMLSNDVLVGSEYANRVLYSLTGKYGTVVRVGVSGIPVGHRTRAHPHSSLRVGVLGTIDSNKGQIIALKAVSMARAEGLKVELILAGAEHDQGYSNKLRDFAVFNKLEGMVSFLGRIENTASFFEAIDVLAVCSYDEVFPTVILEAMRERKLVIATKVGGIPEIIEDGLSGLLYQAGNASELSRCLIEVSKFGDFGLGIIERAHSKFYELYQISNSVDAIKERFNLLLSHSG